MTAFLIVVTVIRIISVLGTIDMLLGAKPGERTWKVVSLVLDGGLIGWAAYLICGT